MASPDFALMRAALDQTSRELGRYVRLTSYASGLCRPEIATLAGLERLDMMLSDCMHGIITGSTGSSPGRTGTSIPSSTRWAS